MSLQTFHIASDQWELTASWFPGHAHLLFYEYNCPLLILYKERTGQLTPL